MRLVFASNLAAVLFINVLVLTRLRRQCSHRNAFCFAMPLFGPQSKDDAPSKSRRRALTAPLDKPARIWLHRQKTHVQTQSSLLYRLPLEVRELIYAYSFGWPDQDDADLLRGQARQKIHVFANKFGHLSCGACMSVSPECTTRCYKPSRWGQPTGDFLNILLSCRQM